MKKIAGLLALFALTPTSYAADESPDVLLDKVTFQVTARQWVNTKTALLTVNVNATLTHADLAKARAEIMGNLSQIAKGDWHLLQFERSQDNSGLEKLTVQAQARVDQTSLTEVYQHAKSVSKPGTSYEISMIEFKPSLEEVQQIKTQLREQLYQQTYAELARINRVYTGQNYTLYNLTFVEGDAVPLQPKAMQAREAINTMALPAALDVSVSNELTMTAVVQAASNRQGE
ncbi:MULTISPECIES: hypothetical protein [Legionella]|uniref:hypothetical protein n=1 Tax=Legionella TaxID=445 RepID=UPI000F8EE5AC|nr:MULTISPECIES: hypothetical protein [Legionella]MCP0914457.1 hypothetical protein [Legionella sp. 27cVA30]RUQ97319.1 hypothetical protein ELY11_06635 [Legionella septentrionalis]RUR10491.1 hypothetical protein ELY14_05140 [Legionella septentrionalis]RUR16111.1 hypothetical protein ELY10_04215 [Legionella septentrionalis]